MSHFRWLPILLGLFIASDALAAQPLADWQLTGQATMRYFGLRIYTIRLWTRHGVFYADQPFALELEYAMRFSGHDIVARTLQEMRHQGRQDETQLARWSLDMHQILPDVHAGDRLIGIALPGQEAQFYLDSRALGSVRDPAFVRAFFDIWLAPSTSAPDVRLALLSR